MTSSEPFPATRDAPSQVALPLEMCAAIRDSGLVVATRPSPPSQVGSGTIWVIVAGPVWTYGVTMPILPPCAYGVAKPGCSRSAHSAAAAS